VSRSRRRNRIRRFCDSPSHQTKPRPRDLVDALRGPQRRQNDVAHHQPIPLSLTSAPTSEPPRTGPSNDPHRKHPEDHHPHRQQRVTVGCSQPVSAAALTPGLAQTARRRRSPPERARPGHRRGPIADRGIGAAAGRGSRRQHHPPASGPVAVRLPADPGDAGRLRRRCSRRDRPSVDR
jgi:hypothetical protein